MPPSDLSRRFHRASPCLCARTRARAKNLIRNSICFLAFGSWVCCCYCYCCRDTTPRGVSQSVMQTVRIGTKQAKNFQSHSAVNACMHACCSCKTVVFHFIFLFFLYYDYSLSLSLSHTHTADLL